MATVRHAVEWWLGKAAGVTWRLKKGQLLVLTYHRVLPPGHPVREYEQPGMVVSPGTLQWHIHWLREAGFEFVDLADALQRSAGGRALPDRACALTFDDGWRDNHDYAFPVLVKEACPATIFLVSEWVGSTSLFWPERLARVMNAAAPALGADPRFSWAAQTFRHATERGLPSDEVVDRVIVEAKRRFDDEALRAMVGEMEQAVGGALAQERHLLDWREARTMARSGLVRFGSHSGTHRRLAEGISSEVLEREIVGSKRTLAEHLDSDVSLFAYPNGDWSVSAEALVRHHYQGACSTLRGWYRGSDPYRIERIGCHEDIASRRDAFLARVSGWL